MKIAYYMPFKPLDHPHPSGDLITGTELFNHLSAKGHDIAVFSRLRCRWMYYRPDIILHYLYERNRILAKLKRQRPDIWLTYHSYYKAPDLLGSYCCRQLKLPYVIFQGIYSTKRKKKLKTWPGYLLNKKILVAADHIFTNKKRDHQNLQRLIPADRLEYVAPGIHPDSFSFSMENREILHKSLSIQDETVIMTAAMMRPGVKSEGISAVMECCAQLIRAGKKIRLLIVGDGECREKLKEKADLILHGKAVFLGKIKRDELYKYYSAADIFAFPGINESLGMVYLEAQSCGIPVVACKDWGGGEAVVDQRTGLLNSCSNPEMFFNNLQLLIDNSALRRQLGKAAALHIRTHHNLQYNYERVANRLSTLVSLRHRL